MTAMSNKDNTKLKKTICIILYYLFHVIVFIHMQCCCTHLFVFKPFSVDKEGVASQQFGWQQPAHAHSAQAAILRQPAAIISGHHHRFDAHNVAVTATHQ